jgi:hypothetical protein
MRTKIEKQAFLVKIKGGYCTVLPERTEKLIFLH